MTLPHIESAYILCISVIQAQDEKKAVSALQAAGFEVEIIATSGSLLGRKNSTLLISTSPSKISDIIKIIEQNCHQRTEYITTPLEGAPLPIPISTPITIGGAVIFILPVDYFEEI